MKVYFMSTPRGKESLQDEYSAIYKIINKLGYAHTTKFFLESDMKKFYLTEIKKFYHETTKHLKQSDICVFEVSTPSLAIGHLIGMAQDFGKPIIALYTNDNIPLFLSGVDDEKIQIINYRLEKLEQILKDALEYAAEQQDVRFNFFISPRIQQYLDWIVKHKRIPRAVYLRNLLNKDMKESQDWQKRK